MRLDTSRMQLHTALAVALFAFGGMVVLLPAVVALVVPVAASVLVLVVLVRRLAPAANHEFDRRLLGWTLAAFAVHLAVGLVITHWHAATAYFGNDATLYDSWARQLVQSWSGHAAAPTLPSGKEGFFYVLGGLYWVFGSHPETGLVFNALLSAALIPVLHDVTTRLFGREAARPVAPLVVLLPGILVWTSQLLREAAVLFLIVAAADLALRLSERLRMGEFSLLTATLALLFLFRANVAYVLLGGLAVGLILSRRHIVSGLGLGASVLSLSLVLVVSAGVGYSGYRTAAGADLNQVNTIRLDSSGSAASGFAQSEDVSTPTRAAAYLPYGLLQFALGPFPWQVRGIRQIPALVDVAVLWALIPSLRRGFAGARRRHQRGAFILLVPAAITACMLSLLVANFGTVVRERMQVLVLLIPFISLGLALRNRPAPVPHARPRAAMSPR